MFITNSYKPLGFGILEIMRFSHRSTAAQSSLSLWCCFLLCFTLFFLVLPSQRTGLAVASDASNPNGGRIGCPNCSTDGSEISQLLQKADALYATFKAKEALRELLKVLQMDPQNHEALAKLSRVYIDFGDMVPESGPDWQERRLKQYLAAEEFARKAVKADPKGTWGHFYVAASLGKVALQSPITKQIDLSQEIQEEVEKAMSEGELVETPKGPRRVLSLEDETMTVVYLT